MGMKTEITVIPDDEDLLPDPEYADQVNTMLVMEVRIDMFLMNRHSAPEDFVDKFLLEIKQHVLNHFYRRYPERIPNANS